MNNPPLPDILIDVPPTPKFKRGDVVRLNSGGPAMTVGAVNHYEDETGPMCYCWWYPFADGDHPIKDLEIREECLTLVTP